MASPLSSLSGTIQNDVLKEYIARGTHIYPPKHSLRITTDILAWCDRELPRWNPISISGYHIREAGATAVQEVAFTLADGLAYVEAARSAGLDLDRVGERLSFFFAAHNDFIEEIAKFRAARRLWAHIMRDRFGVTRPRAMQLRFHAQTAGSTLTARQPNNNIVRVAIQAMAAVLGGAQSLHCNGRDEALALPTEESARLALRTQQIIASETGVTNTVDPVGGAWTIERHTDRIEEGARALIAEIDASGGTLAAIERGWIQRQIHDTAYAAQRAVDEGTAVVVGVNRHVEDASVRSPTSRSADRSAASRPRGRGATGGRSRRAAAQPAGRHMARGGRGGRTSGSNVRQSCAARHRRRRGSGHAR